MLVVTNQQQRRDSDILRFQDWYLESDISRATTFEWTVKSENLTVINKELKIQTQKSRVTRQELPTLANWYLKVPWN